MSGCAGIAAGLLAMLALAQALPIRALTHPQGGQTGQPAFEIASIHPSGKDQREINGLYIYPGGRIACRGCTLQYLIMRAFNVEHFQIAGGPALVDWETGERFEIQARPPVSSPSAQSNPPSPKSAPSDEQRQMLQSLLADRFQLRFHREVKDGRVYILTKGRGKLKLTAPKDKNAFPWAGGISGGWFGGGMRGQDISMPQLAVRLSRFLEGPVLDQTGIEGSFDFEYPTGADDNDSDIPGFLMSAMKAIGLDLKSGKGSLETIVIDQVKRPSEN
jgi:uncharacterized protein (TIGR03435 family)